MSMNKRRKLHDQVITYLNENNYDYFQCGMYLVDPKMAPLRDLLKKEMSLEEKDLVWAAALSNNRFYNDLRFRFGGNSIHTPLFIEKIGDFILDLNSTWHLVELKTSKSLSSVYNFNYDSFVALRQIPWTQRKFVHILFYNDAYKTYYMAPFSELKFDPCYYHFPEISSERKVEVENYLVNHLAQVNKGEVDEDIDRATNVYLTVDINSEANRQVVQPLHEYMGTLKYQNNLSMTFPIY
jgi:hypothetical protein